MRRRRPEDIPPDAPTVSSLLASDSAVLAAICRRCPHTAVVDLAALERRGMGNVPLLALRLRCTACGAPDCDRVVEGRFKPPF